MKVDAKELRARYQSVPGLLEATLSQPLAAADFLSADFQELDVVGVGASEAPARLLVTALLSQGIHSRFVPISSYLEREVPKAQTKTSALVVFSQGLSPNAQIALSHARDYRTAFLFTSVDPAGEGERSALLRQFSGAFLRHPPVSEAGSLVRLVGPVCASLLGLRLVSALVEVRAGKAPDFAASLPQVPAEYARIAGQRVEPLLTDPAACLALGSDVELARVLMWKWQEGLYTPLPVASDVLAFAHGPLQSLYDRSAVILALEREGSKAARDVYARLTRTLAPSRHQVRRLLARLPSSLAFFEFDAWVTGLLLAEMEARRIDPGVWPGQATDQPLYSVREPSQP